MKEIIEFTVTTDDPEGYFPYVAREIDYGYRSGHADSENFWESKVIGHIEDEDGEV